MIKSIGAKRFLIILVVGVVFGAVVATNYYYLDGEVRSSKRSLGESLEEITKLQGEIDTMQKDFAFFEQEKVTFQRIVGLGFFEPQDRVLAREKIDTVQKLSKIISAKYQIQAARTEEIPLANESATQVQYGQIQGATDMAGAQAGYSLVKSPMTFDIAAMDDLDVYRFIYYMNYAFPGHITINKLTVSRKEPVNTENLKLIGLGTPPTLIEAKLDVVWQSLAKKENEGTSPQDMSVTNTGVAQ